MTVMEQLLTRSVFAMMSRSARPSHPNGVTDHDGRAFAGPEIVLGREDVAAVHCEKSFFCYDGAESGNVAELRETNKKAGFLIR